MQPLAFAVRIVGDRVGDDHARLVQPDMAFRRALLSGGAAEDDRLGMQCGQRRTLADEGAEFGHLGQHHRHDFQRGDLVLGKAPGGFRLHDQHAELFAQALDRQAGEGGIDLLARLRHVSETRFRGGVGGVDRPARARDPSDQALAQAHPGLVDRFGLQALGRAKLQRLGIAEQIDRADLGPHLVGDEMGDLVQTRLTGRFLGHRGAEPRQHAAAVSLEICAHAWVGVLLASDGHD